MREVVIAIEGLTAYSASQQIEEKKKSAESWDEFEKRTWRDKAHATEAGDVYIPGVSFKMALDFTAGILKEKIVGKGNQTYSPIFKTGVVAMNDLMLGIKTKDLKSIRLQQSSNGKKMGGSRVPRWFPYIPKWGGTLEMRIFNDTLPEDIFERYFSEAGLLCGVGRGRPEMGCAAGNGRFKATEFKWG